MISFSSNGQYSGKQNVTFVAVKNVSTQDGQHLETLAFLLGYSDNDNLIATDLVFPKQRGQAHKVDDEGIVMLHFKNSFIAFNIR